MTTTRTPVLPLAWGEVLDQVQQSLTRALEHANQRLQALDAVLAVPAPAITAALTQYQDRCAKSRQQLDAGLNNAARQVKDADTALAAAEEALRTWLHDSAGAQRTLAERAARAVG